MKVDFAVAFGYDAARPDEYCRLVRSADEAGFAMVCHGDSPALFGDTYVGLALIALNTTRCRVGSFVSNPVTRHPAVTASAISSVNELSGGRAVLGISTGDSGVYNFGLKAATVAELEEYITALREMWRDSTATFQGKPLRFMWSRRQVPIYISAAGPKTLRLAGRIADGVFVEAGLLPEVIEDSLGHLAAGAAEGGRRLDEIDVWWHARCNIGSSYEDAAYGARSALAGMANHAFRFTLAGKRVPEELRGPIQELQRQYGFHQHVATGAHVRNAELVDELGLRDYLARRFAILGTPEDWRKRVEELAGYGVRQIALAAVMEDRAAFFETMGREVIPRFQS